MLLIGNVFTEIIIMYLILYERWNVWRYNYHTKTMTMTMTMT